MSATMRTALVFLAVALAAAYGRPSSSRIVGGEQADYAEYPFAVSLKIEGLHNCGGTLISNQWVLTAAHCIMPPLHLLYTEATLNEYDVYVDEGRELRMGIDMTIPHENFTLGISVENDIGLIKLSEPVEFFEGVQPLALAEFMQESSGMATTIGWGADRILGMPQRFLQEVDLPVVDDETCLEYYPPPPELLYDYNICAGELEPGKSACPGDSGGPLICSDTGNDYVCGVTSWIAGGVECGGGDYPVVFTQVSHFRDWIDLTIAANS